MSSKKTNTDSIVDLTELINSFCKARDWDQFHSLKDLAIGAVTESAELLDWFRFQSEEDIQKRLDNVSEKEKLSDELADSFYFLLRLAQKSQIDLGEAVVNKLAKNNLKYPVETARGKNTKA